MNDEASHGAYRSTAIGASLVFVANTLGALVNNAAYGFGALAMISAAHAVLAAMLGIAVYYSRARWTVRSYELVFAILLAPFLVDTWLPPIYDMRAGSVHEPLLLHHLTIVGIALLAPTLRSGIAAIVVFLGHAVALWQVLEHGDGFHALAREPWFTLLIAGVAIGLLWSRISRRELELRLTRAEAHADAMLRFGRVMLGLRDRANTPLQTLMLVLDLLVQDCQATPALLDALHLAIARLNELQGTVAGLAIAQTDVELEVDLERSVAELLESLRATA